MYFPVIGVHGPARSGKDTVTQYIISRRGGYRYGLADPIKRMIIAGLGIDMFDEGSKEDMIPLLGKTRRQLMQTLGTEWGRDIIHPDIWVFAAQDHLARRGPGMIISDVRFENEVAWVRRAGGRVIHLERPDAAAVAAHSSENGVRRAPGDAVIVNDAGLEELFAEVRKIVG